MSVSRNFDTFFVYFGGGICVGTGSGEKDGKNGYYVTFQELEKPAKIGSSTKQSAIMGSRVALYFQNVDSVDVVIEALSRVKKKLQTQ